MSYLITSNCPVKGKIRKSFLGSRPTLVFLSSSK